MQHAHTHTQTSRALSVILLKSLKDLKLTKYGMSHRDWIKSRVETQEKYWEDWLRRLLARRAEDPWKIIERETGVRKPKGLTCTHTLSYRIPTLPFIPFYDKVYFFISNCNHNKAGLPIISSIADFKETYGLLPNEVIELAEEGSLIPVMYMPEYYFHEVIIDELIYKLEQKAIPHIPYYYSLMFPDLFQVKNEIALPSFIDPYRPVVEHLLYACGLESVWVSDIPISPADSFTLKIIERTLEKQAKSYLFRENLEAKAILEGLELAYSPEMNLRDYLAVFTPERRKTIRELVEGVIKEGTSPYDAMLEINRAMRELEDMVKSKHWRLTSYVGSLMKTNALTVAGTIVGMGVAGPVGAIAGAIIGYLGGIEMPDELLRLVDAQLTRLFIPVAATIIRKPAGFLHLVQMRREIIRLRKQPIR